MPGLFWKPHSAQTLAAVPSAATAAAALAAEKAVPQARQNWASSLFSVPHTEQSLLIRSASAPSSDGRRTIPCFMGPRNLVRPFDDGQCANCAARRGPGVLYAFLKAFHLLGVVVWIGGMAFMLFCLRPAARVLEPPARVTLMHAAIDGIAWSAAARAGLAFNMPLDWYTMIATFFVMLAVFVHIRSVLFSRLDAAVTAAKWPDGAAALAAIRWEVSINLVLGTFVIFFVRLGGTA